MAEASDGLSLKGREGDGLKFSCVRKGVEPKEGEQAKGWKGKKGRERGKETARVRGVGGKREEMRKKWRKKER